MQLEPKKLSFCLDCHNFLQRIIVFCCTVLQNLRLASKNHMVFLCFEFQTFIFAVLYAKKHTLCCDSTTKVQVWIPKDNKNIWFSKCFCRNQSFWLYCQHFVIKHIDFDNTVSWKLHSEAQRLCFSWDCQLKLGFENSNLTFLLRLSA